MYSLILKENINKLKKIIEFTRNSIKNYNFTKIKIEEIQTLARILIGVLYSINLYLQLQTSNCHWHHDRCFQLNLDLNC